MTKRKRAFPSIDEILARPWCYYCERDFDDHKILVGHQKAKHFKCPQPGCTRRLNTAGGLGVHMMQVHKVQLQIIENALPSRKDINIEIFAMEGIPQDVLDAHKQRITHEYFKRVAEHRAQTGNPLPGQTAEDAASKKPKLETPEELKQRLAEHKARREAERRAALGGEDRASLTPTNSMDAFALPGSGEVSAAQGSPMQIDPFSVQTPSIAGFPPPFAAPFTTPGPFAGSPPGMPMPFGAPPGMPGQFMPPTPMGVPQFPPPMPFGPPPGVQMPIHEPPFVAPPHKPAQRVASGPDLSKPNTPLDTDVPGLPARPSMAAPNYSREDMARLHAGAAAIRPPAAHGTNTSNGRAISESIDDLISSVRESKQSTNPTSTSTIEQESARADTAAEQPTTTRTDQTAQADTAAADHPSTTWTDQTAQAAKTSTDTTSKKSKKGKAADSKTKLVYSDNATSPEEKRAKSSRYAFKRDESTEYVLGDAGPAVTGTVRNSDDVMDTQSAH